MFRIIRYNIKKIRISVKDKLNEYNITGAYILVFILALAVMFLGASVFIKLTRSLKTEMLVFYDKQITESILSYRSPALTQYFVIITKTGNAYSYLIVIGLCAVISFLILKKWKYMVQITLVLLLSALSNSVIKRFVNRARPDLEHLVTVKSLSYPSGHAMVAMAFYGFVAYLFYKFNLPKFVKVTTVLVLLLLILSIGVSRIYLGVHFPSDVLGGFIAGAIWVVFCIIIFNLIAIFKPNSKIA